MPSHPAAGLPRKSQPHANELQSANPSPESEHSPRDVPFLRLALSGLNPALSPVHYTVDQDEKPGLGRLHQYSKSKDSHRTPLRERNAPASLALSSNPSANWKKESKPSHPAAGLPRKSQPYANELQSANPSANWKSQSVNEIPAAKPSDNWKSHYANEIPAANPPVNWESKTQHHAAASPDVPTPSLSRNNPSRPAPQEDPTHSRPYKRPRRRKGKSFSPSPESEHSPGDVPFLRLALSGLNPALSPVHCTVDQDEKPGLGRLHQCSKSKDSHHTPLRERNAPASLALSPVHHPVDQDVVTKSGAAEQYPPRYWQSTDATRTPPREYKALASSALSPVHSAVKQNAKARARASSGLRIPRVELRLTVIAIPGETADEP